MKNLSQETRDFILKNLSDHPRDIVRVTAEKIGVAIPTVHRHLKRLINEGEVAKTGKTRAATYFLKSARNKSFHFPVSRDLEEHKVWQDYFLDSFKGIPENILKICDYGFMEMVNNVIDHSEGKNLWVSTQWEKDSIRINVRDDGVGVFRKIQKTFQLEDEKESILQLSKGKLTTDKKNHSGQGIFFTSRGFDRFTLSSFGLTYLKFNLEDDWFVKSDQENIKGTWVTMLISLDSKRDIINIFSDYTTEDPEDGIPRFDKTHILVKLSQSGDDTLVSRSQARRVLMGLEKFKHVVLDFSGVSAVGQGFVDEVFRVYQNKNPHIKIEHINLNDDVKFMIERGISKE